VALLSFTDLSVLLFLIVQVATDLKSGSSRGDGEGELGAVVTRGVHGKINHDGVPKETMSAFDSTFGCRHRLTIPKWSTGEKDVCHDVMLTPKVFYSLIIMVT